MTIATPLSTKELLWLGCRDKTCCHGTKVIVTGADLFRIVTALDIAPWDAVVYAEAPPKAPDGFLLSRGGPRYQLVLAKRGRVGRRGAPCAFLWKLADGHAQCGLGELRPLVCRSYPATIIDGMLAASSPACTCRQWSVADLDGDADRHRLDAMLMEAAEYATVVDEWNAAVPDPPEAHTFAAFCDHVVGAYRLRPAEPR